MSTHTKGPMQYGHRGCDAFWIGPSYDQPPIATVEWDTEEARENARENAAEMVRRWNLIEAQIEAAEQGRR